MSSNQRAQKKSRVYDDETQSMLDDPSVSDKCKDKLRSLIAEIDDAVKLLHETSRRTLLKQCTPLLGQRLFNAGTDTSTHEPSFAHATPVHGKFTSYTGEELVAIFNESKKTRRLLESHSLLLVALETASMQEVKNTQSNASRPNQFDIYTEADVTRFVVHAAIDALTLVAVATNKNLRALSEHSWFSYRPDVLVIKDPASLLPVIAVKVNKFIHETGTTLSKGVCGQVYDYARAMGLLGHETPFVLLTNGNETHVCWLDDKESNSRALNSRSRMIGERVSCSEAPPNAHEEKSLPSLQSSSNSPDQAASVFIEHDKRMLKISETTYTLKELVPLLISAMECGWTTPFDGSNPLSIPVLSDGDFFKGPALALFPNRCSWGELTLVGGKTVDWKLLRETGGEKGPLYYAIGILGNGSTSRVFNAVDHAGKQCAVKLYNNMNSTEGLALTEAEYVAHARMAAEEELQYAKNIYKADPALADSFKHDEVNGRPCLVMPFFKPIANDERMELITSGKIAHVLGKFVTAGKKWSEQDVCWHHIGWHPWKKDETVLFDLGNLENTVPGDDDNIVDRYIAILKATAGCSSGAVGTSAVSETGDNKSLE